MDMDFVRPDAAAFTDCPSDSIDYAIMEKTDRGGVASLDCGWSDVGAWSALWDVAERDAAGNVSKGDVIVDNCADSYFRADSRLLAATGVRDLVVVETADAVLVADRTVFPSSIGSQRSIGNRVPVGTSCLPGAAPG